MKPSFAATLPKANPPVCWLCGYKLFGGGRFYRLVKDEQGNDRPAHKQCDPAKEET